MIQSSRRKIHFHPPRSCTAGLWSEAQKRRHQDLEALRRACERISPINCGSDVYVEVAGIEHQTRHQNRSRQAGTTSRQGGRSAQLAESHSSFIRAS